MNTMFKFTRYMVKAVVFAIPMYLVFQVNAFDLQVSNWRKNLSGDQRLQTQQSSPEGFVARARARAELRQAEQDLKDLLDQQRGYENIEARQRFQTFGQQFPTSGQMIRDFGYDKYAAAKRIPYSVWQGLKDYARQASEYGRQKGSGAWQGLKGYGSRASEFGRSKASEYGILPKPTMVS